MIVDALMVMVCATMAQHLGLSKAVSEVMGKILRCNMCLTFWACTFVMLLEGICIPTAVALSLAMAYLSNWLGVVLVILQRIYTDIWEKVSKQR